MKKIYLVDDQPISNFITKKLFELEGYTGEIIDFTDPEEAFRILKNDKDALIFLDLNMPMMNGWDFLNAMQADNVKHQVILLTSSTSKMDIDRAQDFPAVIKYMVKPMNKKKFLELSEFLNLPEISATRSK